ncbi:uncharacterized protein LY79DRAFT_680500 [Colletotrichum navitas]|uniref:Clr5 domain-containing protein n=1 Tax=Colletotrichum navitas TaxID=681940 RepID=A0AAD8V7D2_9PEZI|nr:uncharacterized protein LY79DRAFT_680500 [Colletotrichum navitas]KAK1595729.1 hypothetical protein LY79DRAFT_680500 [Colletotrichum navitas]
MVGQISYTEEQIFFVLEQVLADKKRDIILYEYQKKFGKSLSASQLRYIKTKYGRDPEFGKPSENLNISLIRPSWGGRTQLRLQSQLQREKFPQYQSHVSGPEPTGTYWFDQYAPTVYKTPYGYQPVLHFYNKLLYPSTTQKRQLEEPGEMLPSSAARQMLPIDGFNDTSFSPDTAPESMEEPKAKRARLELTNNNFAQVTTAKPAQMSMDNLKHQGMEQGTTNFCDIVPSEEPAAHVDSDKADEAFYTDDNKNEHFPCSQFIEGVGHKTQPEDILPLPLSFQMPQTWDKNAGMNSTSAQGPTSVPTSLSTATQSTMVSADTSLMFSDAAWSQIFNKVESGPQSNCQASSSFHSPLLLEAHNLILDQAVQHSLEAFVGDAIVETDTSGYVCDGENLGQSGSEVMAVPEQSGFGDGLGFLDGLDDFDNDIDWSVDPLLGNDLTPGVYLAQEVDDQTQSGHSE